MVFKTRQAANLALSRLLLKSKSADFIFDSNLHFEKVAEMWLEQYKNTVKASTLTAQKFCSKEAYHTSFRKNSDQQDNYPLLSV